MHRRAASERGPSSQHLVARASAWGVLVLREESVASFVSQLPLMTWVLDEESGAKDEFPGPFS